MWVNPQGAVYMVAAGLKIVCQMASVGSGWANYCLGCTRKHYSQNCGRFISGNKGGLGSEQQLAGQEC